MAKEIALPTTQRAYTLRLRGTDPGDDSWRDALWATHEAVNKGAKVFGEWLLTLRGGFSHELAELPPPRKGKRRTDGELAALRKNRRILLALSWLSVEDERGAPKHAIVAYGDGCKQEKDDQVSRDRKVEDALRGILSKRDFATNDINSWVRDCESSLKVRIRDDAVWVNRSECFDRAAERLNGELTRDAVWDLLKPVFDSAEKMLAPAALGEDQDQTDKPASKGGDDDTATSAEEASSEVSGDNDDAESGRTVAKDFVKKAGKWLSLRYKAEGGADYAAVADRYDLIAQTVEAVPGAVTGSQLIGNIAQAIGRGGGGRDGIVHAVGYTGSKQRGIFFSRLNEIELAKSYVVSDLQPLLESAGERAAKLRQTSAARKASPKGPRAWSVQMLRDVADSKTGCGFQYDPVVHDAEHSEKGSADSEENEGGANHREYSVMLDHAMRRVSIAHSWIKRAEATRAKFESDRTRIERVPIAIREWLDEFFRQRGRNANAVEGYSVRRRALGGKHAKAWKAVVAEWKHCATEDERRHAASQVQSDWDDEEKFGHSDLFIALADDDALPVWKEGPQALIDYVAAKDAESRAKRYKVPAYRHPDEYHNPVFADFGYSRWRVEYEVHKVRNGAAKAEKAVEQKRQELASHPANGASKKNAETALKSAETRLKRARAELARLGGSAKIRLRLWNGREFVWSDKLSGGVTWRSLRLRKDLALDCTDGEPMENSSHLLTRADRLGHASARAVGSDGLSAANVFLEDHWNARLQAPRRELEARAKRIDKGKKSGLIRWFVTFSPRLEPRGPFVEHARKHGIQLDQKRDGDRLVILLAPDPKGRKRNEWRGLAYPFWHPDHKKGTIGHAKILLSRLPGLRVLSVDLGHRFAAACTVWEALPLTAMKQEIDGREIVAGGTGAHDLYCHTRHIDKHGKERTTVYRRIAADKLPDDSDHPAPWARLDRQFFIKLQGEERPARAATNGKLKDGSSSEINEVALVAPMAGDLGLVRDDEGDARKRGVDKLMRRAMRIATLGLKRHGRRAKIAYAFKPDCPGIPGMGGALNAITRGDDAHIRFLTDALMDWHALGVDTDWDDSQARKLWNAHIKPLPGGFEIGEPAPPDPNAERPTRKQRHDAEGKLRARLEPIVKHLAEANPSTTAVMYNDWKKQWEQDDGQHAVVPKVPDGQKGPAKTTISTPATGWHAHLRLLTDWIMGWYLPGAHSTTWNRNVGGLSLTRIATMRLLYQLHKAFSMRPRPVKVQGALEKGETNAGVAQSILDAMERMREQRVKQIASRIVEAALGVGIERKRERDNVKKKWRYPKRPRGLLSLLKENQREDGTSRFDACHTVVIENLRNYRPDELQTRRENRSLMNWSAGKVRKYLEEACQLHGLHLREVMPNYTSRQCSRTGLPGVRCVDVHVDSTTGAPRAYWWSKVLNTAKKKTGDHDAAATKGDAESRFIVELAAHLTDLKAKGKPLPKSVRVPLSGGDLFVAAQPPSCQANGHRPCPLCDGKRVLQADLNAAANIGIRALIDPDFSGKWWYVPAALGESGYRIPSSKSCAGAACLDGWRVAREGAYYTAGGIPVAVADEETVKQAQQRLDEARKQWEQQKKAMKQQRGGTALERTDDDPTKAAYEVAKKALAEAKKAATQKEIVNLWQDLQSHRDAIVAGRWADTTAYWRWVRSRVVDVLWRYNRLRADRPGLDDDRGA